MAKSKRSVAELTQDQQLQLRIQNGEVTKEEVDRVWEATRFLSAQTPFEMRKLVVDLGGDIKPVEQVTLQAILDLRAYLSRSDSKFAHLVAGTESIVETLQQVNSFALQVERLNAHNEELLLRVDRLTDLLRHPPSLWSRLKAWFVKPPLEDEVVEMGEQSQPPPIEEPYNRRIGSMWDKSNPRKA
jgi:hypothetical protein